MKRTKRIAALALGLLALLLTGCSLDPLSGHLTTQAPDQPTYQPVSPNADSALGAVQSVTLYFEFQDTGFMSTECRTIESAMDTRVEKYIIEELIKGPSADHPELTALVPAGTQVLGVEEREGILFVTLSKEFMDLPGDAPAAWQGDEYWASEVPRRRLLALQSIVCAVTDLGEYDRVQLLIDYDGEGNRPGERVPRLNFYADALGDPSLMLDVVRRDQSLVLTPRNALGQALAELQSKSWEELYQLIAAQDASGNRPTLDEFTADMQARTFALTEYTVGDAMVTDDGQGATVCVDATFTLGDGSARELLSFPVRLHREGEVWKIAYASLSALLEG